MLRVLDAAAVRGWCEAGRAALAAARSEIDDLNVFPVPDRDTGTNLLLTVDSVVEAVRAAPDDLAAVAQAMARGALLGARGNSGVILSQLLRGLADALAAGPAGPRELADGLARGADLAYAAVAEPVEGTMLTIARAAGAAAAGADLATVVSAACAGARAALAGTTWQLPALHHAGVVDAGGRGWVVLLDALEAVVTGRVGESARAPSRRRPAGAAGSRATGPAYEVQFLLRETSTAGVDRLRAELAALGDSLAVVGGDGVFNVHVHVDDVGAAIEAGVAAGRPSRITVTRFADQAPPSGRAVVAVAAGPGLGRLFRAAGAHVVLGATAPSTADLLAAVVRTGAAQVVVLPNDLDLVPVVDAAAAAARAAGVAVAVVPTRSDVQGLAAVAVADPVREFAADVAAMAQAAASTRAGQVTRADRAGRTPAGDCRPGDVLGLLDGRVVLVGAEVEGVAGSLLDRLAGAELLTLVLGADAPVGLADRLRARAVATRPDVEVVVVDGGQPHHPLLLGAE